ncbi:MAG: NYN domain-containing protein [Ilumatobacteraceae bacterium]|jgi:predicted RNA-binding protein with RPS1 domain
MARHVVVDGSNIATEGRTKPSLKQLNEAVMAFMAENPKDTITVIVDATFGHRIDRKEVAEFDEAIANNELVAPPAGTVGRGDAFVLMIAQKVGASILSNDSYQEFHGQYPWLFHEGRLIGGKPVPHVGWVFVNRTPVRGEKSRRSGAGKAAPKVSAEAMKPMPVPKAPPPGAKMPKKKAGKPEMPAKASSKGSAKENVKAAPGRVASPKTVNDVIPFLHFLEKHPIGSTVKGTVESYSSHGAYVQIGDVRGYVPLRLMGDPPPRAARDVMALGDQVSLEVMSVVASRRSIDLKPSNRKSDVKIDDAKSTAKKSATPKKAATPKTVAKKATAAKDGAAKKVATKKVAVKKVAAKKVATKKTAAKTTTKKAATPKTVAKKATTKKTAAPKKSARATVTKK